MAKVLLGFVGVGKSSVAPYLDGRFVDMDQVIEEKIGMSIADFFAKEGEAAFRQIESETLEELLQEGDDVIISTGGGVVVTERNRQLWRKIVSITFGSMLLRCGSRSHWKRIPRNQRPLSQSFQRGF